MNGPSPDEVQRHLRRAVELAQERALAGHRPYAAVVVRDGEVLGEGVNDVLATGDPTTHAEVQAVRTTCAEHGVRTLAGAWVAVNCRPCEMCQAALRLAGITQAYIAGECESGPELVRPELVVSLVPTSGAAGPFETFRATGQPFVDDPALGG
jgi:tRNA(Arg) A34 adenosine deaminase TadA